MKSLLFFWSGFNVTLSEHWICPHDPHCLCEAPLKRWRFMVKYISDDWFLHQYKARLDVWLTRRCRKMLTFTLWVAVLRAVLIFQTPLLFKDQRSITVSQVCDGTEKGKLLFTRKENTSSPVKQGYRSKAFPFGLLITMTLTDRAAAETANIWGKVQTSNIRPF